VTQPVTLTSTAFLCKATKTHFVIRASLFVIISLRTFSRYGNVHTVNALRMRRQWPEMCVVHRAPAECMCCTWPWRHQRKWCTHCNWTSHGVSRILPRAVNSTTKTLTQIECSTVDIRNRLVATNAVDW